MNDIHNNITNLKNHLMNSFSNKGEVIEKSITQNEFDEKYGVGYEVFTEQNLLKFKAAVSDKIQKGELLDEEVEGINEQLIGLSKVIVKGEDNNSINLYVRRKVE